VDLQDRKTMPAPTDLRNTIIARAPADEGAGAPADDPALLAGSGHMRIARDGTWYHEGRPIRRPKLVKLFETVLQRELDGGYWLVTPAERVPVAVDDAPYVAEEVEARGVGRGQVLSFRTNVDTWVEAGPDHPVFLARSPATGELCPYMEVRTGLSALIARSVFYRLADMAEPDPNDPDEGGPLGVWSHGMFFPLERPA
jgi:hypothetical protein